MTKLWIARDSDGWYKIAFKNKLVKSYCDGIVSHYWSNHDTLLCGKDLNRILPELEADRSLLESPKAFTVELKEVPSDGSQEQK